MQIKGLTKFYGSLKVYENFNLTLEDGKITCILGRSGSGKTTLLNALASLTDCKGELPEVKCSYIFQSPRLVPNLTVKGNLMLICKDEQTVNGMIERVGLKDRAESYPAHLSGGEAQRVAIARAFLYESDVLLMDEPFASLDLKTKSQMLKLFFEVWQGDGRTVLMVTHDVDEAVAVAQRVLVLDGGEIVFDRSYESAVPRGFTGSESMRAELVGQLLK